MSLIHQALKKLEGTRHGYSAPDGYTPTGFKDTGKRLVVPLVLIMLLVIAGTVVYSFRSRLLRSGERGVNKAATVMVTKESPATAVQPQAQAPDHSRNGVNFYKMGQLKEALVELKEAVRENPGDHVVYNNLGLVYMSLDDLIEAEGSFIKALQLYPSYPEALNNYGSLLDRKGERQKALENFKRSIALDPKYPDPYLNTAITLERMGKYDEAMVDYEKFLQLGTDQVLNNEIRKKLARLRTLPVE